MGSIIRSVFALCALTFAVLVVSGCAGKAIEDYETRLKALESGGTPDSLLSSIRVNLMQAKSGKKTGNGILVRTSLDSLKAQVAAAEKWFAEQSAANKAHVDGLVSQLNEKKKGLSGMQLREADSLMGLADSFIGRNWYIQARRFVDELDTIMPTLIKDEAAAKKVSARLPGTWYMTKKHRDNRARAMEKRVVTFAKDGSFQMDESMKGQTSPTLKEDWQFKTSGSYSIKGDTILLSVQKEKCLKESYWNLRAGGRWVHHSKPSYDTVITDGKKDRFLTFEYLASEYKKR
ncbi:MAG: hypothetical protein JW768_12250 [Chitinispirillaceae bacterium]|nr:hypothetical protein [Chitinispirillaceae bacterium]